MEKKERVEENKEVLFNLGSSHLELIGSLLTKASNHYLENDLLSYLTVLRQIKTQISQRLLKIENQKFGVIEEKIYSKMRECNKEPHKDFDDCSIIYGKIHPFVTYYAEYIMECLEKKGYLVPLKESRTSVFGKTSIGEE